MCEKMNEALDSLRDKYGFAAGDICCQRDCYILRTASGEKIPLLPQRVERRIIELKKMIDSATLEDVSTLRFASFAAGGSLEKLLAVELDLAEYLADCPATRIFACGDGKKVCNCIVRFANGISASIECGINLPDGTPAMDRHEIIARRGVGCDRTVDTQVPQHSIYLWNDQGTAQYTDIDTELFGLPNDEILVVRAAYAVLKEPALAKVWHHGFERASMLAAAALASAEKNIPVEIKG